MSLQQRQLESLKKWLTETEDRIANMSQVKLFLYCFNTVQYTVIIVQEEHEDIICSLFIVPFLFKYKV